jgi:hypothetical protein
MALTDYQLVVTLSSPLDWLQPAPSYEVRVFSYTARAKIQFDPPLHTALFAAHEANVAEVSTFISLKYLDFRAVIRSYQLVPSQPKLPAIGHSIAYLYFHDVRPFPVPAPPIRRMQAPEILGPPFAKMLGRGSLDFPGEPGTSNSHPAARLHKSRDIIQVQIIGPK